MRSSSTAPVRVNAVVIRALSGLLFLSAVLQAACSDDTSDSGCTPGEVQSCPCPDDLPDSTQICAEDGASWGECECTDTDADSGIDEDCSDTDPCLDPPDTTICVDENTLGYYDQEINGTCIDGECSYSMQTIVCEYGCITAGDESKCYDPCEGVVCNDPPGPWCDAVTLNTWTIPGICHTNDDLTTECWYVEYTTIYCDNECIVVPDGDDYCGEE